MKIWTWVVSGVALLAVGGAAGFGVAAQQQLSALEHAPAYSVERQASVMAPVAGAPVDQEALFNEVSALAQDPRLGTFHARISNGQTGAVVFDQLAGEALTPASSTKVLTASAAILALGADDTITTDVVQGAHDGAIVIRSAGDVWLDAEALDELAAQIPDGATAVYVDNSVWEGAPTMMPGWDPVDIGAGFVAPLEPLMLSGGRTGGATQGDVPRTHTPSLDVAQALADRLGAQTVGFSPAPEGAQVVASVTSPDLITRMRTMMKESDNVYAEAIGREIAAKRQVPLTDAPQATLAVLQEHGFDTQGVTIADNSGLSTLNKITPLLLDTLLNDATMQPRLRPLLTTLPVAAGEGTLESRYVDLPGRGFVRAKTGTLDEVSALAGMVVSEKGNLYTFAFLSNGSDILDARRAMDELASALRKY